MKIKIKRFERKWIFKSNNYLALINALLRSNLFFRTQYPLRKVNSVYFDTYNYSSIRQNLDGVSYKKMIRIRWYGNKNIMNNPLIEIKKKRGFETFKESIKINELDKVELFNLDYMREKLNKILKLKKFVNPILTTHYEREYFISQDGNIRATLDYNLQSIFLNNLSQIDIVKNFNNTCILEFKYSTSQDKYVRKNLKDITLRLSKNSKFVNSAIGKPKLLT